MTDSDVAQFKGHLYDVFHSYFASWRDLLAGILGPMSLHMAAAFSVMFLFVVMLFAAARSDYKKDGTLAKIAASVVLAITIATSLFISNGTPDWAMGYGGIAGTITGLTLWLISFGRRLIENKRKEREARKKTWPQRR